MQGEHGLHGAAHLSGHLVCSHRTGPPGTSFRTAGSPPPGPLRPPGCHPGRWRRRRVALLFAVAARVAAQRPAAGRPAGRWPRHPSRSGRRSAVPGGIRVCRRNSLCLQRAGHPRRGAAACGEAAALALARVPAGQRRAAGGGAAEAVAARTRHSTVTACPQEDMVRSVGCSHSPTRASGHRERKHGTPGVAAGQRDRRDCHLARAAFVAARERAQVRRAADGAVPQPLAGTGAVGGDVGGVVGVAAAGALVTAAKSNSHCRAGVSRNWHYQAGDTVQVDCRGLPRRSMWQYFLAMIVCIVLQQSPLYS